MKLAILIACLLVAAFRPVLLFAGFNRHVEASYQAVAHMLVGGLLGAWLMHRKYRNTWSVERDWLIVAFWALTAVEVICATAAFLMR